MKVRRTIFFILIIINCMTIFYFSNQVANVSSNSSGRIINFLAQVIPVLKNMPEEERQVVCSDVLQPIVRKTAHFSIYTLLGFFTMNFALTFNVDKYKRGIASWGAGTLYAVTDELHQYFVPGRSCEFRDVCIDSLGVFTGIMIAILIVKIFNVLCQRKRN